jgi:putative ABC transport system permease protein
MPLLPRLSSLWRNLLHKDRVEQELSEEVRSYLEMLIEAKVRGGLKPEEARRAALIELGGVEQVKESVREIRMGQTLEAIWQDIRYGARLLLKSPGFTLVAVITLGLGIGANTAIFSVVNAALLKGLPYDATRLVAVEAFNPQKDTRAHGASPADFWDWQEQSRTFEQLTLYSGGGIGLKESERVEMISGARVAVNFFATFGVQPMLGRAFVNEEGLLNGPKVIILSHRLWQQRYGSDPQIVGRTLQTGDGAAPVVIGVMPPDFKFPSYAQIWTPLARDSGEMKSRVSMYCRAVGRIKQGETLESAQAEMNVIAARLATSHPKENQGRMVQLTDWRESLSRDSRKALLVLMGAVGFVLLIGCANLANLMLARAATRSREMAIRLALGATRAKVLRQLLTESLLLSLFGGALGLLLAVSGVHALTGLLPKLNFTFQSLSELRDEIRVDRVALLFTLVVSILTGLIFGLAPGWQTAKTDVNESLKEGVRSVGAGHQRARQGLVIAEIAMALALLVGAGLLINSFARLLRVDPGYDPQGLMTMSLSYPAQSKYAFAQQVMERVAATPGVTSVALMSYSTLGGLNFQFNRENNPLPDGDVMVAYSAISPAYLRTLKTPLLAGREFDDRDLPNAPQVAIINETMARQFFAGENPIGQKIDIAYLGQRLTREIVGVGGDVKQEEPSKPTKPEILVPFAQLPWFGGPLLVRSAHPDPLTVKYAVQQAIWSVNPEVAESKAEPLTATLEGQVAEPRLYALLLGVFAFIALVLAAVGIYSVIAYSVAQRTQEIGVRLALGAQTVAILKLVLGQGMKLVASGVALGLAASFSLSRLMSNMLFGVSAVDPMTFGAITLLLMFVGLLACWIPARRAMRLDPMVALRYE